ncbi:MAG TPA: S53 family peptidase [Candidatus Acidoferrum sp.]|jgi:kumamolisin
MKSKSAAKSQARASVAMVVLPGSTRHAVPQARLLKKSDPKATIQVSVYVRRNPTPPGKSLSPLGDMNEQLPSQRHYASDAEFNETFGASQADLDQVAAWAKSSGLTVTESSVPMRRVKVKGTIANISKAFGIQLNEYNHPESGEFRGREGDIRIPADLAGVITGVFGLDTRQVGRPRIRRANAQPVDIQDVRAGAKGKAHTVTHALPAPPFPGTFYPPQVAALYDYPSKLDGTNQNVAIFAFNGTGPDPHGGYKLTSLETYFEQVLGGKTPTIKDVVVQGPGNDPGPDSQASSRQGDATGEVMLDMCVVGSVAPGANIFMYFTEFTSQGWLDGLNQAITDANKIDVISISYGNPEDDPDGAWTAMGVQQVNQAFEGAAAKGITICCASGDDGSSDQVTSGAHVDFPASSPFVLGVGGTKLVATAASPATIDSEVVWNESLQGEGATGGGVSAVFTKPTYQNSVSVPTSANPPHNVGRGVPDVAAVADPETGVIIVHVDGKHLEAIGGTSAAAPMWASLIARLNQGLKANCGFLNALIYNNQFPKGAFRDITSGNNGAYKANSGWDACTGFGTPIGDGLLQALSGSASKPSGGNGGSNKGPGTHTKTAGVGSDD